MSVNDLIKTLGSHGVSITTVDVPEVLRLGADTFFLRRGVNIAEKSTLELYLNLNEMRQGASRIETCSGLKNAAKSDGNPTETIANCKTVSI